jgi:hypothetical protein
MPRQNTPQQPQSQGTEERASRTARGARSGADARGQPEKQKENQRRLRVDSDHRTPEMKKGHRGTFP